MVAEVGGKVGVCLAMPVNDFSVNRRGALTVYSKTSEVFQDANAMCDAVRHWLQSSLGPSGIVLLGGTAKELSQRSSRENAGVKSFMVP